MQPAATTERAPENPFTILGTVQPPSPSAGGRSGPMPLVPDIPLEDGEQYRFHFDMSKCVGCKCCEVACIEQNNNPARTCPGGVSGESRGGRLPAHPAHAPVDGLQPLPGPGLHDRLPDRGVLQGSDGRVSSCTTPTPASAASTASGTVRTACRPSTRNAGSLASATCATNGLRTAMRRRVSTRALRKPWRSRSWTSASGARMYLRRSERARPAERRLTRSRRPASRCPRICRSMQRRRTSTG